MENKGMKRSLGQSIYKFLPNMWAVYKSNTIADMTIKINSWYNNKIENVYNEFLEVAIKRQINEFGNKGGDISSFNSVGDIFEFVEPRRIDGQTDIEGEISPLFFYCSNPNCQKVKQFRSESEMLKSNLKCTCGGRLKQLQMIYACPCGNAFPVKTPYINGVSEFLYKPNDNRFNIYYRSGNLIKSKPLVEICSCGKSIGVETVESTKNFRPWTVSVINLLDKKSGEFYEKGERAQKLVLAKWFDKMSQKDYDKILNNVSVAFSEEMTDDYKENETYKSIKILVDQGLLPEEKLEEAVSAIKASSSDSSVDKFAAETDKILASIQCGSPEFLKECAYYIMQYDTVKSCKNKITFDDIVSYHKKSEYIEDESEIIEAQNKLGIKDVQVSCNVEIVSSTFGFTRKAINPKDIQNGRLKLNSFGKNRDKSRNLAYTNLLETEGILFNIDMVKIINWLKCNSIIKEEEMPDTNDELTLKKWIIKNVDQSVPVLGEELQTSSISSSVISLLHSISHALIKSIAESSGLGVNSLSEVVFPNTCSIFIYAQSTQGLPLGALSGMAESKYLWLLNRVYEDNRVCAFDPICSDRDESACSACIYLPEITCKTYNSFIGRKYLYSINDDMKGFWDI